MSSHTGLLGAPALAEWRAAGCCFRYHWCPGGLNGFWALPWSTLDFLRSLVFSFSCQDPSSFPDFLPYFIYFLLSSLSGITSIPACILAFSPAMSWSLLCHPSPSVGPNFTPFWWSQFIYHFIGWMSLYVVHSWLFIHLKGCYVLIFVIILLSNEEINS